jgi:pimeloyl-ACP methyl ester carboxylesterase
MTAVAAGLLFAGALVAALWAFQDHLLFFPRPLAGPEPSGLHVEAVLVAADDGPRLRGWLIHAGPTPSPLVIYFGGNAEEVSWLAGSSRFLTGWSLLLMNYRGYGRSEGRPSERTLFADALRVFDHAAGRADVESRRIVAMGRSLGSGVAVHLAAHRPLVGAVLVTPFDSITAVARRHYPYLPVRWLLRHPFDSLARAPILRIPLLCLVAGQDAVIPPVHARRLYEGWAGPKAWREFPAADHDGISDAAGYWEAIAAFLADRR